MARNLRTIASADLAFDARCALGEGPVWDHRSGRLVWLDLTSWWDQPDNPSGVVHIRDPSERIERAMRVEGGLGSVAIRAQGGLIVAAADGLGTLDIESGAFTMVRPMGLEDVGQRFNDGGCDPRGRFWAGTAERSGESNGGGALYRVDVAWNVEKVLTGVQVSNGIGWSPDGRVMYYADTPTGRVDRFRFDVESGSLGRREVLSEIPRGLGLPDGLAVDAEGCVWVAVWGSSRVVRYTPHGLFDTEVILPVTNPTSCAFGGPNLETLYVTTAWATLTEEQRRNEPHAGGVFAVDVGAEGLPVPDFAG